MQPDRALAWAAWCGVKAVCAGRVATHLGHLRGLHAAKRVAKGSLEGAMRRPAHVSAALAAVMLLTGASCSGSDSDGNSGATGTRTTGAEAAADDGSAAEAAVKRLETDPGSVLASGARDVVTDVSTAFPNGTKVAVRQGSWSPDGTGSGGALVLSVTYPGKASRDYLAVMVKEGGTWKVLTTLEATS